MPQHKPPPILSIVGRSNSGKTTIIEKIIPELKKRAYRIGTVKHASMGFDLDKSGKDSSRLTAAGAETVLLAASDKIAMIKHQSTESLDDLQPYFEDLDLVITEGYKKENKPKIEVIRAARHTEPVCRADPHLIAVIADCKVEIDVPAFGMDQIEDIADFIESQFLTTPGGSF